MCISKQFLFLKFDCKRKTSIFSFIQIFKITPLQSKTHLSQSGMSIILYLRSISTFHFTGKMKRSRSSRTLHNAYTTQAKRLLRNTSACTMKHFHLSKLSTNNFVTVFVVVRVNSIFHQFSVRPVVTKL